MINLRSLSDVRNPHSLANKLRAKRFRFFKQLASSFPRPLSVIDVGGTQDFWEMTRWAGSSDIQITIVNLEAQDSDYDNIAIEKGDATDLSQYSDRSFDIAFSNSVIEHLFSYENQLAMAQEMRRVARAYWVQTPNFWFPIEPHFQIIGWQWLPLALRTRILQRYACGRRGPYPNLKEARERVEEVNLMTRQQLVSLFPDAEVWPERFVGLVKSWVLYSGFPEARSLEMLRAGADGLDRRQLPQSIRR